MPAAVPSTTDTAASGSVRMDRDFIAQHQIIERYLGGRLPVKGAQDFEHFCREHPELLDEISLSEHINAALKLLETGGHAPPWEERPKQWWERLPIWVGTAAVLCALLATITLVDTGKLRTQGRALAGLQQRLATQPLDPPTSTRSITLIPSRTAPSRRSLATIGGGEAQLADLKIDVSWSKFSSFRVTIDRIDQGRVAILHNVLRDSNGELHLELNSSALGPGDYQLTLDGLTWSGQPVAQAWATISIAH